MKYAMTKFAADRHFNNKDFSGTKIVDMTPEAFVAIVNKSEKELNDGYAPFCKHLFVVNFALARSGIMTITPENEKHLRSGYQARREGELPVLGRWFEGVEAPLARWLDIILYSREQLLTEGVDVGDAEWGIVSINAGLLPFEDPMPPVTMMRNALGIAEGGSGVPLDREAYERSVAFWSTHAVVR